MLHFLILILFLEKGLSSSLPSQPVIDFDKNYVGVVYEPYTKYHEDRHDYTIDDVQDMLLVVTKRFKWISTYGMGTISSMNNWNEGHAGGLSGVAASYVNKKMNALELIVNLGTWYNSNDQIMNREIENAFSVAEVANNNFKGTVNGVIITSYNTYSDDQLSRVVQLLKDNFMKARNMSLQLGVRTSNCDALSHSVLGRELVNLIDFINCQKLPTSTAKNVSSEVRLVGEYLLQIQKELASVKPDLYVVGETGWASFDKINGQRNYDTSVKFWLEMGEWAKINKFRVDMFTAFDEPWKISIASHEPHFGWWKRVKNDSSDHEAFVEKFAYVEPEPIEPTTDHTVDIILGTIGSLVFLAMFCGLVFLYRNLVDVKNQLLTKAEIEAFEKGIQSDVGMDENTEDALRLPYDRSYEIPRKNLVIDTSSLLGSGAFGSVYMGKVEGQDCVYRDVACKLTQSNCTATAARSLLSEIKIMIHVGKHPNVVSIIGACTGEIRKGMIMIATELCLGGSLEKRLREYKANLSQQPIITNKNEDSVRYINVPGNNAITGKNATENCLRWSYEIACGMEHISSKKQGIYC
ncbi:uncharacterized protein LOC110847588 isoform X2 [Folsomia candida]|uniref:uncharacterized protein LOC110847588 isoform X2 n=1 Tax=Folsomia candida TaxID=158441 RepID=UPI00160521F9|nr:uncharacterized protein LOC110847588 isoform X2 [Folsomia candida]